MNQKFWKGKKVLLTGHTGFKGGWLSLWLQKLNVKLVGYSKSIPTKPSFFKSAKVEHGITSIFGDVCDYKNLNKVIRKSAPEIVIHMAAQSILRESYKDPLETYSTNVMGTVNLLESIRHTKNVRVVIIVTSDKCYQIKPLSRGYKEDDPMGGYDPYSSSKGCAELVTSSFRNSFFNPDDYQSHKVAVASCRAGNVIGGGDWAKDRLIPDIVRGIINKKNVVIRKPKAIRPWQFVLEPLYGYLILAEKLWHAGPEFSEGWNFGPNKNSKTVQWITEKISDLWGGKVLWELDAQKNLHEERYLKLDSKKAQSKLEWGSKMNISVGLEWTIDWYKQYQNKANMRKFSEKQIENYMNIIEEK